jgi:hypothetical protein
MIVKVKGPLLRSMNTHISNLSTKISTFSKATRLAKICNWRGCAGLVGLSTANKDNNFHFTSAVGCSQQFTILPIIFFIS